MAILTFPKNNKISMYFKNKNILNFIAKMNKHLKIVIKNLENIAEVQIVLNF